MDWNNIFSIWRRCIQERNIPLRPFFTEITVYDPGNPTGRDPVAMWLPDNSIRETHLALQRHFERWPGTNGPTYKGLARGEFETLQYLWAYRNNVEAIAAIMISASLFPELKSSRKSYPWDEWPPRTDVLSVYNHILKKWHTGRKRPWHHSCVQLLPHDGIGNGVQCSSLSALIRSLADNHARILTTYRPVAVVFTDKRNPFITKTLVEEYILEESARITTETARKKEREAEAEWQKRMKIKHPRWGEWPVSKEELTKLIWSMPAVKVAELFGISDDTVAKQCKCYGIKRPPLGFWVKVNAGNLPHPKGAPIERN